MSNKKGGGSNRYVGQRGSAYKKSSNDGVQPKTLLFVCALAIMAIALVAALYRPALISSNHVVGEVGDDSPQIYIQASDHSPVNNTSTIVKQQIVINFPDGANSREVIKQFVHADVDSKYDIIKKAQMKYDKFAAELPKRVTRNEITTEQAAELDREKLKELADIVRANRKAFSEETWIHIDRAFRDLNKEKPVPIADAAVKRFPDEPLGILLPLYLYPTLNHPDWMSLVQAVRAHENLDVMVIANPGVGPGQVESPDYSRIFRELRGPRLEFLGFINCINRTDEQIQQDVDGWSRLYRKGNSSIGGFYFSRLECKAAKPNGRDRVQACRELFLNACKAIHDDKLTPNPIIVVTPLSQPDERIMDANPYQNAADHKATRFIVCNETNGTIATPRPLSWASKYPSTNFAQLAFGLNEQKMINFINDYKNLNACWVYATNLSASDPAHPGPGEWSSLTQYWPREVETLLRVNDAIANGLSTNLR